MKRLCALLICLLLTCAAALAADIPEPTEDFYVYDGANVLDYETEGHIVFCNRELYEACGAEIVFVTVDTVGNETMEDYCLALINEWEVGDARKQNGFVVVLAIDDDDYGWMPGTGLDLELSAGVVHELADAYLEPDFADRDYDAGARKFFDVLFERIADICGADVALADGDARFEAWLNTEDGAAGNVRARVYRRLPGRRLRDVGSELPGMQLRRPRPFAARSHPALCRHRRRIWLPALPALSSAGASASPAHAGVVLGRPAPRQRAQAPEASPRDPSASRRLLRRRFWRRWFVWRRQPRQFRRFAQKRFWRLPWRRRFPRSLVECCFLAQGVAEFCKSCSHPAPSVL